MVTIPTQLAENMVLWMGELGQAWLDELPERIAGLSRRWEVVPGEPFGEEGVVSWVAPATTADGQDVVLKVFLPDVENALEADALRHYDGRGAVRLLADEPGALLLERLRPGTSLWSVEDDDQATEILATVASELWRPPAEGHGFRVLRVEAERWAQEIPEQWERAGRPFERSLAELGASLAADLAGSQREQVVLHQDLHGGNVLAAARAAWLAIDPKPLVGEREFDLASRIRDTRERITPELVRRRLDLLTRLLGLDRERARGWAIVHAQAWGFGGDEVSPEMVQVARWLAAM
jgi:streptomycin 6-kinase